PARDSVDRYALRGGTPASVVVDEDHRHQRRASTNVSPGVEIAAVEVNRLRGPRVSAAHDTIIGGDEASGPRRGRAADKPGRVPYARELEGLNCRTAQPGGFGQDE